MKDAIARFQALGHDTRLRAFRLVIAAGRAGITAGEIAAALDVPPSTLSNHLAILERAGLLQSWRVHRSIYYAVAQKGVSDIVGFLTRDCCRGAPELCGFPAATPSRAKKARKAS